MRIGPTRQASGVENDVRGGLVGSSRLAWAMHSPSSLLESPKTGRACRPGCRASAASPRIWLC